jgi:ferredoxin-NADP reductase
MLPARNVDVRLTAEDGYRAERSYAIATAPESAKVARRPRISVCCPTAFVDRAADLLVQLGHDSKRILVEGFDEISRHG